MKLWNDIKMVVPILAVTIMAVGQSCTQIELHESHYVIKNAQWSKSDTATGSFIIEDSNATYNISIIVRHRDKYAFNNIWLSIGLSAPGDTLNTQKINVPLGTDATGWHGTGFNDIWEVRSTLTGLPQRFKKTGTYKYSINQIMRADQLQHVMSIGLRIERAQ